MPFGGRAAGSNNPDYVFGVEGVDANVAAPGLSEGTASGESTAAGAASAAGAAANDLSIIAGAGLYIKEAAVCSSVYNSGRLIVENKLYIAGAWNEYGTTVVKDIIILI